MNSMDGIINLDSMLQQALESIDEYKQNIARVDADMQQADRRLRRYMATHERLMRGLRADRRQRATELADFRKLFTRELEQLDALVVQRLKEREGISAQEPSLASQN